MENSSKRYDDGHLPEIPQRVKDYFSVEQIKLLHEYAALAFNAGVAYERQRQKEEH